MTEEEAAAYVVSKELEFNVNKKNSSLFADDLDGDPNSQTKGKAAFGFKPDPTIASKAADGLKSLFDPASIAAMQAQAAALPVGSPQGAPIPGLDPK